MSSYTATLGWGNAFMANSAGYPTDITDVTINAGEFLRSGVGSYGYPNQDLDIYTGGGIYNKIRVVGDTTFGSKLDSVTFGSPVSAVWLLPSGGFLFVICRLIHNRSTKEGRISQHSGGISSWFS